LEIQYLPGFEEFYKNLRVLSLPSIDFNIIGGGTSIDLSMGVESSIGSLTCVPGYESEEPAFFGWQADWVEYFQGFLPTGFEGTYRWFCDGFLNTPIVADEENSFTLQLVDGYTYTGSCCPWGGGNERTECKGRYTITLAKIK